MHGASKAELNKEQSGDSNASQAHVYSQVPSVYCLPQAQIIGVMQQVIVKAQEGCLARVARKGCWQWWV